MNIESQGDMSEKFQIFLSTIEDSLVELEGYLSDYAPHNGKILDESPSSLLLVEAFFVDVLDKNIHIDISLDVLFHLISVYMGEIVRKKKNGSWKLCAEEDNYDYGYPRIANMDGLNKDFGWNPFAVVSNFMEHRKEDMLKECTFSMAEFEL